MKTKKIITYVVGIALLLMNVLLFFRYRAYNNSDYDVYRLLMWIFLIASVLIDPLNEQTPKFNRIAILRLILLFLGIFLLGYTTAKVF